MSMNEIQPCHILLKEILDSFSKKKNVSFCVDIDLDVACLSHDIFRGKSVSGTLFEITIIISVLI